MSNCIMAANYWIVESDSSAQTCKHCGLYEILEEIRFPKFSITGSEMNTLYPVEGVIATIEIKTNLDSTSTLHTALDNCLSVMKLPFMIKNKDQAVNAFSEKYSLSSELAQKRLAWDLSPKTYIFAFNSNYTQQRLLNDIQAWLINNRATEHGIALLPRIIVGKGIIGIAHDSEIGMDIAEGNPVFTSMQNENIRLNPLKLYIDELNSSDNKTLVIE